MSFIISLVVIIWAVVMGLYYMVSKYVKSSDVDQIKARLTGVGKNKKKAKGALVESSVVQQDRCAEEPLRANAGGEVQAGPEARHVSGTGGHAAGSRRDSCTSPWCVSRRASLSAGCSCLSPHVFAIGTGLRRGHRARS